jgi:putative zinc finger/helix-turn-helix YgiT family protein
MFKLIKKFKGECPICERIKSLSYGTKKETVRINKQKINVLTRTYYCNEGKHHFYSPEDEENKFQNAYREYRNRNGLLQPEEIKEIREKYGLSQRAFARFLGWGEITIQRYETGAIQDNAHNNLLLLINETRNFEGLFKSRKKYLLKKDVEKISKKLKEMRQLSLSFVFKKKKGKKAVSARLIHFPRIQYHPIYSKPKETCEKEMAFAQ